MKKENVATGIRAVPDTGEVASVTDDQYHLAHFRITVSMGRISTLQSTIRTWLCCGDVLIRQVRFSRDVKLA